MWAALVPWEEIARLRSLHAQELSGRQQTVAVGIGFALSNPRTAGRLGLSEHTVRHHAEEVCVRLGVQRREAVTLWFWLHGRCCFAQLFPAGGPPGRAVAFDAGFPPAPARE